MIIEKDKVLATRLDDLFPLLNERYIERFTPIQGEHYRFLRYLSWQYNNATFVDIGTRGGASAMCLADNRSNKVISIDITDEFRTKNNFDLSSYPNIEFIVDKAEHFTDYSRVALVLLDIDHSGVSEERVLRILDESFHGILIMDDINYKYKHLNNIWDAIERPKEIIPYAHFTGTGIVSFGEPIEYR